MKFSKILTVALVAGILSLNAQAQNAGPFLWSSYIGVVGNYLQPEGSAVRDLLLAWRSPSLAFSCKLHRVPTFTRTPSAAMCLS